MENHPIPQDITGFKFKLIGKMTVRQFAYLATGIIIAWVFYILPFPFIIRLPFIIVFASLGAALAFVPIGGRPLDTMVINFIKALFAPTEYVYQKQGGNLAEQASSPPTPAQAASQAQPQQSIPVSNQTAPPPPAPLPPLNLDEEETTEEKKIAEEEKKTEEEAEALEKEVEEAKKEETQTPPAQQPLAYEGTEELEGMLAQALKQKEELEKELLILKSKLESQSQETPIPPVPIVPPAAPAELIAPTTQTVNANPAQPPAKEKEIPGLPQEPNLITGVIKDPRGNPLQNILVEVKDQEDNPVRAFKTNGLGRFASATSLSNGKYSITLEDSDGKNKFDTVEIEATGTPIMPLEIISVDPREELRRELFN